MTQHVIPDSERKSFRLNRVWCDGQPVLACADTGEAWRRVFGVAEDRDLWVRAHPNDVLVEGETVYEGVIQDAEFFTAPRRISGA